VYAIEDTLGTLHQNWHYLDAPLPCSS